MHGVARLRNQGPGLAGTLWVLHWVLRLVSCKCRRIDHVHHAAGPAHQSPPATNSKFLRPAIPGCRRNDIRCMPAALHSDQHNLEARRLHQDLWANLAQVFSGRQQYNTKDPSRCMFSRRERVLEPLTQSADQLVQEQRTRTRDRGRGRPLKAGRWMPCSATV